MNDVTHDCDEWTDGELLHRTRTGHREAFGVLYERRCELVLAFLLKRTRNPEVAMDLMAETFAAAFLAVVEEPPAIVGSAAPWLLTIARNIMVDSYRRGRVQSTAREWLTLEPVQISDNDVEQVLRGSAETDLLIRLSEELPPDQFDELRARALDGHGYKEIAQELACSAMVVRKRVSRDRVSATGRGKCMSDFHSSYMCQLVAAVDSGADEHKLLPDSTEGCSGIGPGQDPVGNRGGVESA
jgi:RNA polymerase sigma factor (sigma-70 family)